MVDKNKKKKKRKARTDPKRALTALYFTFQENSEDVTSLVTDSISWHACDSRKAKSTMETQQ